MSNLEEDIFAGGFLSDEDNSLKSKGASVKFGLNTGKLTKFQYTEESGKEKNAKAIEIEITIGDKVFMTWINEVTKVFGKNGELTDTESEEYKKNYTIAVNQARGIITHFLKIFYKEDVLKTRIVANGIKNLVDYMKFASEGVNAGIKAQGDNIDIFLQYQWKISAGQNVTFLEIPKNMKDGGFVCKAIKPVGNWVEVRNENGLSYKDEKGNEHTFTRNTDYLKSNKAIQQGTKDDSSESTAMNAGSQDSKQSAW